MPANARCRLSRAEDAEDAEANPNVIPCRVPALGAWNLRALTIDFTSHFRLHAAYFVLRNLAACIFSDGAVGTGGVEPSCCSEIGAGEVGSR